jgi:hypothetical protein
MQLPNYHVLSLLVRFVKLLITRADNRVDYAVVFRPDDDDDDDEDISPEAKAHREKLRRQQNNARERYVLCHVRF